MPQAVVWAADIGGTQARFGCYADGKRIASATLETAAHASPDSLLQAAKAALPGMEAAAIGIAVAGPVLGERARLTNGRLAFDAGTIAHAFGTRRVTLVNDIVALGAAVEGLPAAGFKLLGGQPGLAPEQQRSGTRGIVAAGTGLGMGIVAGGQCLPSEGGHARVAPVGALERELLAATEAAAKEAAAKEAEAEGPAVVAWEHYLSGRGIETLHRAVCSVWGTPAETLTAEAISRRARTGEDPVCHTTMETWCGLLATAAGTLAVTAMTLGGVYLAGSIPLAMADWLAGAKFRQRFEEAAWAAEFLRPMPVYLVADALAGLDGAALLAARGDPLGAPGRLNRTAPAP